MSRATAEEANGCPHARRAQTLEKGANTVNIERNQVSAEAPSTGMASSGAGEAAGDSRGRFQRFAQKTAAAVGSSWAFVGAATLVGAWAVSGPFVGFSNSWQLLINTGTTVATFLMVFVIQNTQNRDARAMHLKLDELVRAVDAARNDLINIEGADDATAKLLKEEFSNLKSVESR